jgi:hypothetical protein
MSDAVLDVLLQKVRAHSNGNADTLQPFFQRVFAMSVETVKGLPQSICQQLIATIRLRIECPPSAGRWRILGDLFKVVQRIAEARYACVFVCVWVCVCSCVCSCVC